MCTQDANGTITDFTTTDQPTDFNATSDRTYITTNTPGLNVHWDFSDSLTGELDVAQSTAHLNPNHTWTAFDVDTGYGNGTPKTNNYTGGVVVSSDDKTLPYWSAYGPNAVAGTPGAQSPNFLGQNPYIIGSHVVPITVQYNTDKINQVRLQGSWHNENTKVNFGAHFLQDVWDSSNGNTLVNGEWQLWSGYGPGSNNTGSGVALPQKFFTPVSIADFAHGYNSSNLPQVTEPVQPVRRPQLPHHSTHQYGL